MRETNLVTAGTGGAKRRSGIRQTGNKLGRGVGVHGSRARSLARICIFHSEVIRLHGVLCERLV